MFFFMESSYGQSFGWDKICAKRLKRGKNEGSTHVFGSFNAQKAEGLIAPQQIFLNPLLCFHPGKQRRLSSCG
jgi:hypothetical protein